MLSFLRSDLIERPEDLLLWDYVTLGKLFTYPGLGLLIHKMGLIILVPRGLWVVAKTE